MMKNTHKKYNKANKKYKTYKKRTIRRRKIHEKRKLFLKGGKRDHDYDLALEQVNIDEIKQQNGMYNIYD
jgi:hypothetical protein